jgi:hypothetical protein
MSLTNLSSFCPKYSFLLHLSISLSPNYDLFLVDSLDFQVNFRSMPSMTHKKPGIWVMCMYKGILASFFLGIGKSILKADVQGMSLGRV